MRGTVEGLRPSGSWPGVAWHSTHPISMCVCFPGSVPVTPLCFRSPPCPCCLRLSLTCLAGFCVCWSAALQCASSLSNVTTLRMSPCRLFTRPFKHWGTLPPRPLCMFAIHGGGWRRKDSYVPLATSKQPAIVQSLPLLVFAQTAGTSSQELLLPWNPFFRRIYGNLFRACLQELLSPAELDQKPEFGGTQCSNLVLDRISQWLPAQLWAL